MQTLGWFFTLSCIVNCVHNREKDKLHLTLEAKECNGATIPDDSPMEVTNLAIFEVDKETMKNQGILRSIKPDLRDLLKSSVYTVYWNTTDSPITDTVAIFMTAVRRSARRANDNPMSHITFDEESINAIEEFSSFTTGTGLDFSRIYYDDPFRLSRVTAEYHFKNGSHRIHFDWIAPSYCYAAGTWIANEGMYYLDAQANKWISVYFNYMRTGPIYVI